MLPWWWQQERMDVTSYIPVCGENGENGHECWHLSGTVQQFPSLHCDLQFILPKDSEGILCI